MKLKNNQVSCYHKMLPNQFTPHSNSHVFPCLPWFYSHSIFLLLLFLQEEGFTLNSHKTRFSKDHLQFSNVIMEQPTPPSPQRIHSCWHNDLRHRWFIVKNTSSSSSFSFYVYVLRKFTIRLLKLKYSPFCIHSQNSNSRWRQNLNENKKQTKKTKSIFEASSSSPRATTHKEVHRMYIEGLK